jgi:hypothetical protein
VQVRGATGTSASFSGVLERLPVAAGSHSQHEAPALHLAGGDWVRLHLIGDNPLAEHDLSRWLGRQLSVRGTWRNGVLRVLPADLVVVSES